MGKKESAPAAEVTVAAAQPVATAVVEPTPVVATPTPERKFKVGDTVTADGYEPYATVLENLANGNVKVQLATDKTVWEDQEAIFTAIAVEKPPVLKFKATVMRFKAETADVEIECKHMDEARPLALAAAEKLDPAAWTEAKEGRKLKLEVIGWEDLTPPGQIASGKATPEPTPAPAAEPVAELKLHTPSEPTPKKSRKAKAK